MARPNVIARVRRGAGPRPAAPGPAGPPASGAPRAADAAGRLGRIVPWLLVAALGLVLILRASGIVAAVHDNADTAAPQAMADLLARYPHAAAMTGNYGWWNGLWVVQLLRQLPGGTALASGVPIAAMVLCIAGLTWQAVRLFGAGAAVAVPLVAAAIGADTWALDGAWSGRGPSWWAMVAVGLLLVGRASRPAGARRSVPARIGEAALVVAAVLWSAAALSGDALQWTSVVAPAAGVSVAMLAIRRPRLAVLPLGIAAGIAAVGMLIRGEVNDLGYFQRPSPLALVPFDQAQGGAGNLAVALQLVWRGPVGSAAGAASGYLGALVVVGALAAGVTALVVAFSDAWRPGDAPADHPRSADDGRVEATAAAPGPDRRPAAPADDDLAAGRTAWVAFWSTVIVATAVAFVFSSSSSVAGQPVSRYLFGLPLAAGALLAALAARRTARAPVLVATGVLAALAVLGMARVAPARTSAARPGIQATVIALAKRERITRGYASYWTSYPLTLASHYDLEIAPVAECAGPAGVAVCPMYLHYVDRAYEPRPGIRSFLLVDSAPGSSATVGAWVTQAPAGIAPVAIHAIAPGIRMLVYDHDIAADMPPHNAIGEPLVHRP